MAKPTRSRHPGVDGRPTAAKGVDEHPGTAGLASFTLIEAGELWTPASDNASAATSRMEMGNPGFVYGNTLLGFTWYRKEQREKVPAEALEAGGLFFDFGNVGATSENRILAYAYGHNNSTGIPDGNQFSEVLIQSGVHGHTIGTGWAPELTWSFGHDDGVTPVTGQQAFRLIGQDRIELSPLPWNAPWGEWGYAERTSDVTGIGGTDTNIASLGSITYVGGRKYKFTCKVQAQAQNANTLCTVKIKESTTVLDQAISEVVSAGGAGETSIAFTFRKTGISEGAHTINMTAVFSAGTTNKVSASASKISSILVEDIGPA